MQKSVILLILALLMLAAGLFWFFQRTAGESAEVQRAVQATRLAVEANGALENEGYAVGKDDSGQYVFGFDAAIPRYQQIIELFPDETLPYRNLAIARILKLGGAASQSGEDNAAGAAELKKQNQDLAIEAINKYMDLEETAVGHWMQGFLLQEAGVPKSMQPKILEEFQAAAELEPKSPRFWYAVFDFIDKQNLKFPAEKSAALERLRELEPGNLKVILESLKNFAQEAPESLPEYWKQVKPELLRANKTIQNYKGREQLSGDMSGLIQQIDDAVNQGQSQQVLGLTIGLDNVIKSKDPCKTDISRLTANPLDFVQDQFSESVRELAEQAMPKFEADVNVAEFRAQAIELTQGAVLDFALIDVNFDESLDAMVLTKDQLVVLEGPLAQADPKVLLSYDLETAYDQLVAAHLLMVPDTGSGISRKVREANDTSDQAITHMELPHVVLGGQSGISVLEMTWNEESGFGFQEIQQPEELTLGAVREVKLLDYDQDADLDLVVATDAGIRLLMNRTNLTFIDVSDWFEGATADIVAKQIEVVDWDRDVDVDLVVLTENNEIRLLENRLYGRYAETSIGELPNDISAFAVAELDGNASWDLVLQTASGTELIFTETKQWGEVNLLPKTKLPFNASLVGGWQIGDFDNDLTYDLVANQGEQWQSVVGTIHGNALDIGADRYTFEAPAEPLSAIKAEAGFQADLDADGMLDLVVLDEGQLSVMINQVSNANHWLEILPRGKGDNVSKSNHLGLGSLLEVRVGDRYFATTVQHSSVHVGLGHAEKANLARIVWPNGIPQSLLLQKGNQRVEMLYILKGSCPFIYTWDGDQWQFFSDCLWAAPIGLQSSAGGLVPTRNWEYLRIPGDRMKSTDGTYRLMLTEELWESAYFDYVQLQVIDHPVGWEIHTNDKVGPPSIVQHRLYSIDEKRKPLAARDSSGNDILKEIVDLDEIYFKGFSERYAQGFVESHYIELELDESVDSDSTLFLTGWIQPTDTSINVLLEKHPGTNGPEFPVLEVVNAEGNWQVVDRPIGFPGGKTKTMTIPLADVFPTSDHRLRLRTSCEIYWDQIFVADTPEEMNDRLVIRDCPIAAADFKFRGTSRRKVSVANGPEQFDANDVTTVSVWPPVSGPFTAYGDVLNLVRNNDDQMVVLGTGDAVELQFESPGEVPEGMERTFLFYSVGYDKDADLNTLAGQSSLPLPFSSMSEYPEHRNADSVKKSETGSRIDRLQSWRRFWHQISQPEVVHSMQETKLPVRQQ